MDTLWCKNLINIIETNSNELNKIEKKELKKEIIKIEEENEIKYKNKLKNLLEKKILNKEEYEKIILEKNETIIYGL